MSENDRHANRSKARQIAVLQETTESKTANLASNSNSSASNDEDSQSKSDYRTRTAMRFSAFTLRFSGLVIKSPIITIRFTDDAGGPVRRGGRGAAGTGNPEWTLIAPLTLIFGLDATRRFLMLRTQLEASYAIRVPEGAVARDVQVIAKPLLAGAKPVRKESLVQRIKREGEAPGQL